MALDGIAVHNQQVRQRLRPTYSLAEVQALRQWLQTKGTFEVPQLDNGLFPAAVVTEQTRYTGYDCVWVRDTAHIAYSHGQQGDEATAYRVADTLMTHFMKQKSRFEAVIDGRISPDNHYERPPVKFIGTTLEELPQPWPQAQNDALGYFLWFYCHLYQQQLTSLAPEVIATLRRFIPYFQAIRYWQDEDHGHWEETPKIQASSIGAVLAGLQALYRWLPLSASERVTWKHLIQQGEQALQIILPAECRQPPPQYRRYDAALLFLIYPLSIVNRAMGRRIVAEVCENLQGAHGIRRYLGDSFWCADYKTKFSPEQRTGDFSQTMAQRDAWLTPGEEAQWCLFDPLLSVIFGRWFQATGNLQDYQRQLYHFNRALGQITADTCEQGSYKCPELYYLQDGHYVSSDATPLLWTQAYVALAFWQLEQNLHHDV
ncbi:hypothetical protein XM38_029100 [Halomicronema hongdechloris C2206]|uniref:GH15-like domain-containing protein n=1 Tax=Halomicronema hongdechloris C2206 TaxID=1641165 RepID=A0A1Z3HNV2_9CYAN|nr:glycoside hydrolase family 15 protein [Halomicronema hongdechloris]ASC71956.1 hypothetical protein XM38_029100 [Halomicronema hongdechloris C2206]